MRGTKLHRVVVISFLLLFFLTQNILTSSSAKPLRFKMNSIGLSILLKSCICMRDSIEISGSRYTIIERIAVGNANLTFFDELVEITKNILCFLL